MHRRLGRATLSQLAFPGGKRQEFPMTEIPLGRYSCKIKKRKKEKIVKINNHGRLTPPPPFMYVADMVHWAGVKVIYLCSSSSPLPPPQAPG